MTEKEIHLKLSDVVIDNDNLDYIKATGEICGKLRDDLVKLFTIPAVIKSVCPTCGSKYFDEDNNVKRCQDCYTIF